MQLRVSSRLSISLVPRVPSRRLVATKEIPCASRRYRDTSEWKPYHHDAAALKAKMAAMQARPLSRVVAPRSVAIPIAAC